MCARYTLTTLTVALPKLLAPVFARTVTTLNRALRTGLVNGAILNDGTQQIVGRERRERVSHHNSSGDA